MIKAQPYKLKNTIQHYDWGTKGKHAFIPKLLNVKAEKNKPYAELWMGAHSKASSKILVDGKEIELLEAIKKYPIEMLGQAAAKKFSNTLPFLFKVLSANEALSIQVHPSKRQAALLHEKDPINYPDPNQKIEIAIALDHLTALVGFKPLNQIIRTLRKYPEIQDWGESKITSRTSNTLSFKKYFTQFVKKSISDAEGLNAVINKLSKSISSKQKKSGIEKYFLKLHKKYNSDIGLLLLFFLNLVHLKKGEAIFIEPGIPHAYLKGNILECMSNSDNVIRAGLTPKFKDINNLLKVLTYDLALPQILKGSKKGHSIVYKTNAEEFEIQIITLNKKELKFENQIGPRILLVVEGNLKFLFANDGKNKPTALTKGDSVFLPAILSNFKIASDMPSKFVLVSVPA
ncbi:MAG: mannose-6-phosphate isomerase, class I [Ignavibacteriaceae bacterium]|nr:mannose-6-phosphate isomerase, class I [Ignavibacteriaceae bacterium]